MLTRETVTLSIPPGLIEAARKKAKETGVSMSFVAQRALARWVATGEIAPVVEAEKTWQASGTAPTKGAKQKRTK
jgi:hypothetical protein